MYLLLNIVCDVVYLIPLMLFVCAYLIVWTEMKNTETVGLHRNH